MPCDDTDHPIVLSFICPGCSARRAGGWLWADLGDSLALLGHLDRAQRAYLAFMHKSETKSPERTLDVLRNIAAKLKETASGDAAEVDAAIHFLESRLKGSALA